MLTVFDKREVPAAAKLAGKTVDPNQTKGAPSRRRRGLLPGQAGRLILVGAVGVLAAGGYVFIRRAGRMRIPRG